MPSMFWCQPVTLHMTAGTVSLRHSSPPCPSACLSAVSLLSLHILSYLILGYTVICSVDYLSELVSPTG